ncbi:MAG: PQQ-dependent sugar dehydrogenase [Patescibacteria group bacterium]
MTAISKKWIIVVIIIVAITLFGFYLFKKEVGTITIPDTVKKEGSNGDNRSIAYLSLPTGLVMNIYAENLPDARVIQFDPKGRMLVSQPGEGKISVLADSDKNGSADNHTTLVDKINKPHGMAFDCRETCYLYVALSNALVRYDYDQEKGTVSSYKKLLDLPSGSTDRHFTRDLLFLPSPNENILLISIGSSCNVCHEDDSHGSIIQYDTKTGKTDPYVKGLRNAVFMTLHNDKVYATEMGRDGLGDNIPPDEINIIEKGGSYGWPICYGKNIHDTDFDKNTYIRNPCMEPLEKESYVDLQAHSAPLGLTFIPESWGKEYANDLLVAYHGSWNRSVPTGYKIVRVKFDDQGRYVDTEDFITGWLGKDGKKYGRPVDIKFTDDEIAYISDDEQGVIYRLSLDK